MRIAFLAPSSAIHSTQWIEYFQRAGHDIFWVSLYPAGDHATELINKVTYREILVPRGPLFSIAKLNSLVTAVSSLRRILELWKPQVLHVHSAALYALVGNLSGFRPMIVTCWGSDVLKTKLPIPLMRMMFRGALHLTVDGENTRRELVRFGIPAEKIHLIRFGVNTSFFRPLEGNPHRGITILSLRNFEPIYDVQTLIHAAHILLPDRKKFELRFKIAGSGSQADSLRELAGKYALFDDEYVMFLGSKTRPEIAHLLQHADIYVSTSLSDGGLAQSTAEAMACGIPVIITANGDNPDWISSPSGGFLFPPSDANSLAEAILRLASSPTLREAAKQINRERILRDNDYSQEMKKMEALYLMAIKK